MTLFSWLYFHVSCVSTTLCSSPKQSNLQNPNKLYHIIFNESLSKQNMTCINYVAFTYKKKVNKKLEIIGKGLRERKPQLQQIMM